MQSDILVRDHRLQQYLRLAFDILAVVAAKGLSDVAESLIGGRALAAVRPDTLVLMWIPIAYWLGLYRRPVQEGLRAGVTRLFECCVLLTLMATIAVTIFGKGAGGEGWRLLVIVAPISAVAFSLAEMLARVTCRAAYRQWPPKRGIAMVGTASAAKELILSGDALRNSREFRGLIVPGESATVSSSSGLKVLGTTRQLAELINREDLQRVIVLHDGLKEEEREQCRRVSRQMGVTVSWIVGNWANQETPKLARRGGLLLLDLEPVHFTRTQEGIKRALDFVLGLTLTIVFAPLMLILAALVRLTSPGPVLYRSQRVGKGGRHFTFLKFRSMYEESDRASVTAANEKDGHLFKIRNDPRITPIGRILRRFSLDELPQFINVVLGDMSLVGPRPLPASDLDPDGMSARFGAWSEQRSRVRPGITGLWQIGGRSELPFEEMMLLDVKYIREWSIGLDFKILLKTPEFVLSGRGAF